jgi:hypothetical protein
MTSEKRIRAPLSRRRLLWEVVYRPIAWGIGTALIAGMGFFDLDVLLAFCVGFAVGLVHDVVLYGMGVLEYGGRIRTATYLDRLTRGMQLFSEDRWRDALDVFEEILREVPDSRDALYHVIRCHEKLGQRDRAIPAAKRFLEYYPKSSEVRDMLTRLEVEKQGSGSSF